jgi:hypothetical protein
MLRRWPSEAEAGDVGGGGDAVGAADRAASRLSVVIDATAASISSSAGGLGLDRLADHAGAERLGQHQRLPGSAAVLAHTASSATSPVTDSPNLSSGSRTV